MKLIIAIVSEEYANTAVTALCKSGFRVTKVPSNGGFMRKNSVTLLSAVDPDRLVDALAILRETCRPAIETTIPPTAARGATSPADQFPAEIKSSAATIFVTDLEHFIQL